MKAMYLLTSFVSLCINKPIHIQKFQILQSEENRKYYVDIYKNILIEESVLKNMGREEDIRMIPINFLNIDFSNCLQKWINIYDKYKTIIDIISFDGRTLTLPRLYGEIVIIITFLEDIGISMSCKKSKYLRPINDITPKSMVHEMESICMSIQYNKDLGKFISELRAEIVHAIKPKSITNKLNIYQLGRIYYILRLTVQGYILGILGISKEKVQEYIMHYYPYKSASNKK